MGKSFLFISIDEAKQICDKSQYGEATFWEKVKLNIRLLWCKIARAYTKRNTQLTHSIKSSKIDCLKHLEQQELKAKFESQLKKQKQ